MPDQTAAIVGHVENNIRLQVQGLSFAYGDRAILSDLNLDFSQGGMVGLIGPNGAGKTTLLRLLMGMAQPSNGTVLLGGKPLQTHKRKRIAQLVTLVPQDTQIDYAFSVEEMVTMGRHPHLDRFQPPRHSDIAFVREAMRVTGVAQFADRLINTLSGGERQRVLVARAMAQQTPVVLLDEVTANLDLCHQLEIMELARRIANEGRLVIATIHDLAMASRYCDRLLLLAEGKLQADATPANVLSPANLRRYFSIEARVEPSRHLSRGLSITPLQPSA